MITYEAKYFNFYYLQKWLILWCYFLLCFLLLFLCFLFTLSAYTLQLLDYSSFVKMMYSRYIAWGNALHFDHNIFRIEYTCSKIEFRFKNGTATLHGIDNNQFFLSISNANFATNLSNKDKYQQYKYSFDIMQSL